VNQYAFVRRGTIELHFTASRSTVPSATRPSCLTVCGSSEHGRLGRAHASVGTPARPPGAWGASGPGEGRQRPTSLSGQTEPPLDVIVDREQVIPPEVQHHVELLGPVRFFVEFLSPER
jgi:hypothetical protein